MAETPSTDPVFRIETWGHLLGRVIHQTAGLWVLLGKLESMHLEERLERLSIVAPIYVCGLARAGTTIVLEMLAQHPCVATHRYQDYPSVYTPYLWNRYLDRAAAPTAAPVERAQGDRIAVTRESPEAMEEILWMRFFPRAHDPVVSSVLDEHTENPRFEVFYRNHIRKLLLVRGGTRYVAKANYNVTRLPYLRKLFPDARFVIPVRDPVAHVASLMRQHARFCRAARTEPRALAHLQSIGHFEFGPDFRPINVGDPEVTAQIVALIGGRQPVRGWARYWSHVYAHVADRLDASPGLRAATLVLRYEDLCADPRQWLQALFDHCRLARGEAPVERLAATISAPEYYQPELSDEDLAAIRAETRQSAARFGYGSASP